MNSGIVARDVTVPPAFEYVGIALDWFWPGMCVLCLIVGYLAGGCAQRG